MILHHLIGIRAWQNMLNSLSELTTWKKSCNMCIFTQFFKDYDFRSSGMAKTGCKKVYIYHIFYNEIWWHQKKPLMAWLLLWKYKKNSFLFVTIFRHAVTKTLFLYEKVYFYHISFKLSIVEQKQILPDIFTSLKV